MGKISILIGLATVTLWGCSAPNENETASSATADTTAITAATTSAAKEPPLDSATIMKNWHEYMTPGDIHKMLAASVGKWAVETTMWDPLHKDAAPDKSMGTSDTKMILNGLFQESTYSGTMMGMPFQGVGIIGFNNSRKLFSSTWVDNMGSGMMYLEGVYDSGSKAIVLKGKMTTPSMRKDQEIREVLKNVDDNSQLMEMYTTLDDGKEFKAMEIKYTRK